MTSGPENPKLLTLRPKTQELLYLMLWSYEKLSRPSWRNLTESFEGWAYRNGFYRQLARLEKLQLIEAKGLAAGERVYRLTETGRLWALGGRDPETSWQRPWDGRWRLVLFDVPLGQDTVRNKLRSYLRSRGFGYLQNSVWISPDPLTNERQILAGGQVDVESLILLEARPCAGESDAEIVAGAWDFDVLNRRYSQHMEVLRQIPSGRLDSETAAKGLQRWSDCERQAWKKAVSMDPLLPECLLPSVYLGRAAWQERRNALFRAAKRMVEFKGTTKL